MSSALTGDDPRGLRYDPPKKKKQRSSSVHGVNVTDVVRAKPMIKEWADLLLDDLEDKIPQVSNVPAEKRDRVVDELTDGVVSSLITAMGYWAPRKKS